MDKVSIVIPVYNTGEKLKRCLSSVCNQTYSNLQIILIDDGSTDNSLTVCLQYSENDSRITVISQSNHGVSFARNVGITHAKGDYLMFLDSDDYLLLDMVEQYLHAAKNNHADVVVGGIRKYESPGVIYDLVPHLIGYMDRKAFLRQVCCSQNGLFGYVPNKLYRLDLIQNHQLRFPEHMTAQEDLYFALSVYRVAERFCTTSYCGYIYEYTPRNRQIPVEHLLHNQKKLLNLAFEVGLEYDEYAPVVNNIQDITYGSLFHSQYIEEISELASFPELSIDLCRVPIAFGEKKLILIWFCMEKYQNIILYFKFRNLIKRILCMN